MKYNGVFIKDGEGDIGFDVYAKLSRLIFGEGKFIQIQSVNDEEEITDEELISFPKREPEKFEIILPEENTYICFWRINVPEIGTGLLLEDDHPINFIFREEDLQQSGLNVTWD